MSLILRLLGGFRGLFRKKQIERELDEEMGGYLDASVERHVAAGLDTESARRAARTEVGSVAAVKDHVRDVGWERGLETFWQDLRYGGRTLWRAPGFTLVVVLTLGLGIGATVTMFSVMYAVMWRPLPYPDGDRAVVIRAWLGSAGGGLAPGEIIDIRAQSRTLSHLAQANGVDAFVNIDGDMERVPAASATDDMLELVGGVPLELGRPLRASTDVRDDKLTAVVVSHRLWQRLLRGDPHVVGRHIQVNNIDVEVVGVLAPGLHVWLPGASVPSQADVDENVDVWFPNPVENNWNSRGPAAVARLRPDATLEQAQAELNAFATRFMSDHAASYANALGPLRFEVRSLRDVVATPARAGLLALGVAVAFVLLIACVNVVNLMLARAKAREREVAIRNAMGASRARIVRQLLTETLVLASLGMAAGLLLADGGISLLDWLRPGHLPRQSEIAIDGVVASATIALSVITMLVCGLLPAVRLSHRGEGSLTTSRTSLSLPGTRRLQRLLVAAEVALSIVPLMAAGLMLRTFVNLTNAPLGFDPSSVLTAKVPVSFRQFPDVGVRLQIHRDMVAAVGHLPGVDAVSAASLLPLSSVQITRRFRRADDPTDRGYAATQMATLPGYLELTKTMVVQGRDFTNGDLDTRRDVAIVDERFAQALWGGQAMGQRFVVGSGAGRKVLEVVGVTRALRVARVRDEPLPHVFVPFHIFPSDMTLVVKTHADAAVLGPVIKRTVEALGTGRAVHDIRPMTAYVTASIDDTRFTMLVLTAFAAAALLLAGIGLYGTLAYLISQRTQEFGIRVALGASTRQVIGLVAAEGARLAGVGTVLGMASALAVARVLEHLLYGVTPADVVTLASVAILVGLVAVVAISRPAWRASRVDPNVALRSE